MRRLTLTVAVALGVLLGACASPHQPSPKPVATIEIDCHIDDDDCDIAVREAGRLLRKMEAGDPARVAVNWGRGRGQFHAEVHLCYADGKYLLIDVAGPTDAPPRGSVRADPSDDPPCD